MSRFDEIYSKLLIKYRETHQDSIDGLSNRLNQLTNIGKTWEEAVLQYALELGIELPEIKTLIESGKSKEEAIHIVSRDLEAERQIRDIYRPSKTSSVQKYEPSPSLWWYLVPLFFGLLGGIVGYVGVKNEDKGMANNLLNLGIIMTVIDIGISYFIFYIWLPSLW